MRWLKRLRWLKWLIVAVIAVGAIALGMAYFVPDKLREIALRISSESRLIAKKLPATLPAPSKVDQAYWLPQNWTWQERYWFHHASQGTTTIPVPYDWFLALERPELSLSHRALRDDDYLRRLGFIPSPSSKGFDGKAARYGYHGDEPKESAVKRDWVPGLPDNPDALPVGFARVKGEIDPTTGVRNEQDQLGLTCAACHTGHLEYKNVSIRYDGGPAMVNLGEVERAIGLSIGYTIKIWGRLERFAGRLEEITGKPVDREKLKQELQSKYDEIIAQKTLEARLLDKAEHADEGFGRLDALNRIGNQVFFENFLEPVKYKDSDGETQTKKALPPNVFDKDFEANFEKNFARHDAPVSFPPIWDTPFFLWAQYDASVLNELVRNAGEALGVNAKINVKSADKAPLFGSSTNMQNIHRFEEMLRGSDPFKAPAPKDRKFSGLVAPQWKHAQAKFPGDKAWAIDNGLVDKGRELYRAHCFECHRGPVNDAAFDWKENSFWEVDNPDRKANWFEHKGQHYFNVVQMPVAAIGTDRQQSRVLTERRVHLPKSLGVDPVADLNKAWGCGLLPEEASDAPFVLALMAVVDRTVRQWFVANNTPDDVQKKMWGPRENCQNKRVFVAARPDGKAKDVLAIAPHYRARPLDGVWATAPYLHNGSVPTLADMLLPQDRRPKKFCIGNREFNPVDVGLVKKAKEDDTCAPGLTDFDVSLLGNSNRGHSFEGKETDVKKLPPGVIGPELTEPERRALVEYLKTL